MNFASFFKSIHSITDSEIDQLLASCVQRSYLKGSIITAEGQVQRDLLFIEKGAQMSYFNHDGRMRVMAFTYPPSLCGVPDSFFMQAPSRFTLQALSDTECKAISFVALNELFDQSQSIERWFRKMTETILVGVVDRHLELQTLSIEQRFLSFAQRSPHLFGFVPHKYLANYLGIDPTNFSKLYNSVKI